jgi:hypothetical protein
MALAYDRSLLGRPPWQRVPGQPPLALSRPPARAAARSREALVGAALSGEHREVELVDLRLHDAFERYDCSYPRALGRSPRE